MVRVLSFVSFYKFKKKICRPKNKEKDLFGSFKIFKLYFIFKKNFILYFRLHFHKKIFRQVFLFIFVFYFYAIFLILNKVIRHQNFGCAGVDVFFASTIK